MSDIEEVQAEITQAKAKLAQAEAEKNETNISYHRTEITQLRVKENQLREKENLLLRQQLAQAPAPLEPGNISLPVISASRKRRWDTLNQSFERAFGSSSSVPYSSLSWATVQTAFPCTLVEDEPSSTLPDELLDELLDQLSHNIKIFNLFASGKEAKLLFLIAPVLVMVARHLDDVEILVEEEIKGRNIHAHGRFEFVLKRKDKKVCIVEAKKDDFEKGRAQCLVGCESLCDTEQLGCVSGIVTNFTEWFFFRDGESDQITYQANTLTFEARPHTRPTKDSLSKIAGYIIDSLQFIQ